MMQIGFTGTRRGMTDAQRLAVQAIILDLGADVLHHGDCTGADDQADSLARSVGCAVHIHPSVNPTKRALCFVEGDGIEEPKPYLQRNRDIVDVVDALIAAPGEFEEQLRSGTWATVRYARARPKPVWVVLPDGSLAAELRECAAMLGVGDGSCAAGAAR
jgi:hypothetical protein